MRQPQPLPTLLLVVLAVLLSCGPAHGQACLLADFDEDGSPWTIRSGCPDSTCELNFILEVPDDPPLDRWFDIVIDEGCCDVMEQGHYGAHVEMDLDDTYVDFQEKYYPTCICCSAWILQGHFRPDAPLMAGERYVIGTGRIDAVCSEADPPCYPTHDFHATFQLEAGQECEENEVYGGGLSCGPAGADDLVGGDGAEVRLGAVSPNPARDRLDYEIDLPIAGKVDVGVYDLNGRRVARILDAELPAGLQKQVWDLSMDAGRPLADGIYFLRLETGETRQSRMFIVAR